MMKKYLIFAIILCCFSLARGQYVPFSPQQFNDETWRTFDNGDPTKRVRFELSGLTTGTTRTLTILDANMTFIDWTAATENLLTTGSGRFDGGVGVGADPSSTLPLRINLTNAAPIFITLENAGAGDSQIYLFAGSEWSIGIDNSTNDSLKISQSDSLETNTRFEMTTAGDITSGTYNGVTIEATGGSFEISANAGADYWESTGICGIQSQADGFLLYGGTVSRNLTVTGAAITLDAATQTGWGTSLTHAGDNSQAHSDYLINDGNDSTSGTLGMASGSTIGNLTLADGSITDSGGTIDFGDEHLQTTGDFYTSGSIIRTGDPDTFISMLIADQCYFVAGGVEMLRFKETFADSIIFNDGGVDVDFVVEAVGHTHALFVQGSDGAVSISSTLGVTGESLFSNKVKFTQVDGNEYIDSLNDGYMDYGATTGHRFNAPVGIGTTAPDSIFHIKANVAGEVGSHPAGQLIIQDPDDTVFGNAVITGYESDGAGNPDQQLWYLGSSSSGNSNIIFLNRRNSKLQLGTNDVSRLTILGNGNVGIGETSPQDKLEVNGTILVKDKLKFTQDDGNEYIDSLADGYLDYGATTAHRFNANVDITGTIRTAADQDWNLGAASAQADFAGDTKIRVTIGGTDYDIVALAVP